MSNKPNDGGPAFPFTGCGTDGMTLRDYFAAKAMLAVMAETQETVPDGFFNWIKSFLFSHGATFLKVRYVTIDGIYETSAVRAYQYADAMLAAREVLK